MYVNRTAPYGRISLTLNRLASIKCSHDPLQKSYCSQPLHINWHILGGLSLRPMRSRGENMVSIVEQMEKDVKLIVDHFQLK